MSEPLALQIEEPGRWIEEATVDLGEGAAGTLRRGIGFPVTAGGAVVGFVFVGQASARWPIGGGTLGVRAALPEADADADRWSLGGDLLLAIGADPDLRAAAAAGHPLAAARDVAYLDEEGRELVVVTDLRPDAALREARAALARRARLLAEAGLDPSAMLAREAWRDGPPRSIVELHPSEDLAGLGRGDDLATPWTTWVVDPTGLVDDARSGVLGVHRAEGGRREWRALGGTPRTGPPAFAAVAGTANVTVVRPVGVAVEAQVEVELALRAGEPGRLVDLWIPAAEDLPGGARPAVDSDPHPTARTPEGAALPEVDAPFGPRTVAGARRVSFALPEGAGPEARIRLAWTEEWDVSGTLLLHEFVPYGWEGRREALRVDGLPEVASLGKVTGARTVWPTVATDTRPYPTALRLGSSAPGWGVVPGPGAVADEQPAGTLWTVDGPGPVPFAVGRFHSFAAPARAGMPSIRLHRHAALDEDLLVTVRGILRFYDDALPPWPHPELVIAQGPSTPVLVVEGPVKPEVDPARHPPTFRNVGGGVLELDGIYAVAPQMSRFETCVPGAPCGILPARLPAAPRARGSNVDEATRSLALALAEGWWVDLAWSDADAWIPGAVSRLYRDRFVEEAWGRRFADRFDRATDEAVAREEPPDPAPFTADPWAEERGARLLRAVVARVGEKATLRGLAAFRAGPRHDLAHLVAALEESSGVALGGWFDAFAVAGLRPELTITRTADGAATLVADPLVGTFEVPVRVGGHLRWVPLVDGVGSLPPGTGDDVALDPEGWLPLGRTREREDRAPRRVGRAPEGEGRAPAPTPTSARSLR